jgi:hypothetical protein
LFANKLGSAEPSSKNGVGQITAQTNNGQALQIISQLQNNSHQKAKLRSFSRAYDGN